MVTQKRPILVGIRKETKYIQLKIRRCTHLATALYFSDR